MMRTAQEFLDSFSTNLDRHLGARYNKQRWLDFNNTDFQEVNFILVGLMANGKLEGEGNARWAKAYLLAPSIRVIYELSLLSIVKSNLNISLPNPSVSKQHKENVTFVQNLFKDQLFWNYLSSGKILFDTFQEAKATINNTDFGASVDYAQLASHKSVKDFDIDTIIRLFNEAVLFAILCQQFVLFQRSNTGA